MTRKVIRYSNCYKRSVVDAIENGGMSISECGHRYGIQGTSTIQRWLRTYGKHELLNKAVMVQTIEERDELRRLREENKQLKIAYAELAIAHRTDQRVFEVADDMPGSDLKKSTHRSYHAS